jgi:hypothetical protein
MTAELEVGVNPLLEGRRSLLLQLPSLRAGDRVVQVGERRAAP